MSPLFSFPYGSAQTRIIQSIFASNSPKIDPVGLGCQPPKDYFDSAPAPASAFACVPRCVCVLCAAFFAPKSFKARKSQSVNLLFRNCFACIPHSLPLGIAVQNTAAKKVPLDCITINHAFLTDIQQQIIASDVCERGD